MFRLDSFIKENNLFVKGLKLLSFEQSSTHTALEAATIIGCTLEQIIKTIVIIVIDKSTKNHHFLVILPGNKKLRQKSLRKALSAKLPIEPKDSRLAKPEEVFELTGFNVGEVPPISIPLSIIIDKSVLDQKLVYGGGGTINNIIEIPVHLLITLTNPIIAEISTNF